MKTSWRWTLVTKVYTDIWKRTLSSGQTLCNRSFYIAKVFSLVIDDPSISEGLLRYISIRRFPFDLVTTGSEKCFEKGLLQERMTFLQNIK